MSTDTGRPMPSAAEIQLRVDTNLVACTLQNLEQRCSELGFHYCRKALNDAQAALGRDAEKLVLAARRAAAPRRRRRA